MKKTKQSFEWNKVTPLSKVIAMVLFVVLPFVGFALGMKYQQQWTLYPNSSCQQPGAGPATNIVDKPTPTEPILAQQIERFDFTDTYQITGKNDLTFTLTEPTKASGMVPLMPDQCLNDISSTRGLAIQHQKTQPYWCADKTTFARFVNTSDPAAFIINAAITNNRFESITLETNHYLRAYYQDSGTNKWKQAISMTSEYNPLKSKNSLEMRLGFGIPQQANMVLLAAGVFTNNSVTKDNVQRCYVINFVTKQASRSSCSAIW